MAERKAVNKWYPPDWDPSKGSLNTYHGESWRNGSATVNGRAGAAKGVEIIRFEMPWNMWCTGCNKMVGRGVRYNAEKKKAGKYYTTTLWSFSMKCHMCDGTIVIETDPKNDDYRIVSGGKRKEETWKASSSETQELMQRADKERMEVDPMYRLEHGEADKRKAKTVAGAIVQLIKQSQNKSDYDDNAKLRHSFRARRKELEAEGAAAAQLLVKASLAQSAVSILPEHPDDRDAARRARFAGSAASAASADRGGRRAAADALQRRKRAVARESIFQGNNGAAAAGKRNGAAHRIDPSVFRLIPGGGAGRGSGGGAAAQLLSERALVRRKSSQAAGATMTDAPSATASTGLGLVADYDSS